MKISIITISYNSAETIKTTMESVLSQQYDNIEYIVVDGKSTDGTLDDIKQLEPKFKGRMRWVSEPDTGIYDAMNKGLKMATGDIIGILNSDDHYCNVNILNMVARCFEQSQCDAVFGDIEFVSSHDESKVIRYWKSSPYQHNSFKKGWHPPHPSFFVKREMYERYGYFDTNFDVSADFEIMLRLLEKNRIETQYIPETFVQMRYGGESTGSLKKIIMGNRNILKAFRKNGIVVNSITYLIRRMIFKIKQFK